MSVATVASSRQFWDALVGGYRWTDTTLTFSFATSESDYGANYSRLGEASNGFGVLNAAQEEATRSVFAEISGFTNLSFSESTGSDVSSATLRFGQTLATATAHAYFPGSYEAAGDVWFRNNGTYDSPVLGSYAYTEGFLHEIGHALGLAHGHEIRRGFVPLGAAYDSNEFTVMTYRDHVGDSFRDGSENETWGNAQSFMMLDIMALQYLYGASYAASGEVFSGDTVYSFSDTTGEMFVNGEGQGTPGGNRIFRTIWDGHGTDTYDLSNYTTDLRVDLRPGQWSTFAQDQLADLDGGSRATNLARGNLANALLYGRDPRSLIENAVGGAGNDVIVGNDADNGLSGGAGNDTLSGGIGVDTLNGGDGSDILNGGVGNDLINGGGGDDRFALELGVDAYDGGDGNDTMSFATSARALVLNLLDASLNRNDALGETYVNIETFIGTRLADVMTGNADDNTFQSGAANDKLYGGFGDDTLLGEAGTDYLYGETGDDRLNGGLNADLLYGGAGADTFVFSTASGSTLVARDTIYDFSLSDGDLIDLLLIDANLRVVGDQAFTWVDTDAFSGVASELRVDYTRTFTIVSGDLNGDRRVDFSFNLNRGFELTADSFLL